jgi:hypothetical protein
MFAIEPDGIPIGIYRRRVLVVSVASIIVPLIVDGAGESRFLEIVGCIDDEGDGWPSEEYYSVHTKF